MQVSSEDANLVELDQQLCFKLYAASRLVVKAYRPMLQEMDITYPQYLVLMVLWQQQPVTIATLGERLLLDTGTLSPLLKRMAALDLICRLRGVDDERQVWISLTEKGAKLQLVAVCWMKQAREKLAPTSLNTELLKQQLQVLIDLAA